MKATFNSMLKTLEFSGLTSNESLVYLTLLQIGPSMAGRISKKSEINRTSTYDVLDSLFKKGLITYTIRSNKKWFECIDPETLLELVKEREEDVRNLLPALQKIYKKPDEKHGVTLYYGTRGVKSVFQMILREAKEVAVMDSEGQLIEKMPAFAKYVKKQLNKRKIKVLYLIRKLKKGNNPSKYTEVRFIEKKTASEAVFNIYNDKIVIFIWTDPPEAVVIQNKAAADSIMDYFYMIWSKAKRMS